MDTRSNSTFIFSVCWWQILAGYGLIPRLLRISAVLQRVKLSSSTCDLLPLSSSDKYLFHLLHVLNHKRPSWDHFDLIATGQSPHSKILQKSVIEQLGVHVEKHNLCDTFSSVFDRDHWTKFVSLMVSNDTTLGNAQSCFSGPFFSTCWR